MKQHILQVSVCQIGPGQNSEMLLGVTMEADCTLPCPASYFTTSSEQDAWMPSPLLKLNMCKDSATTLCLQRSMLTTWFRTLLLLLLLILFYFLMIELLIVLGHFKKWKVLIVIKSYEGLFVWLTGRKYFSYNNFFSTVPIFYSLGRFRGR
jgi:hypothetical protein